MQLNMHYCSVKNLRWFRQIDRQRPWTLNIWYGVVSIIDTLSTVLKLDELTLNFRKTN